jgi:dolichyl-diphosphooligosaccharide--protein glycosyltransferase
MLGAAVLVWQGSIVFAWLLAGGLFLGWLATRFGKGTGDSPEDVTAAFRDALAASGLAAVIAAAGRLAYPSETAQTRFDFGFFSWFQPFFLLDVFAGILLLYFIHRRFPPRPGERRKSAVPVLAATLCGFAAAGGALLHPAFREGVASGIRFLMAADPWLGSIVEFAPSFSPALLGAPLTADTLLTGVYLVAFLLPMALLPARLVLRFRRGEPLLDLAVVTFAALALGILALIQRRWANAYSVPMAVGGGWAVALLHDRVRARTAAGSRLPAASAIAAGLFLSLPALLLLRDIALHPESSGYPGPDPTLAWIRDNTPPTSGPWGGAAPEYAVFANWDLGHAIEYVARRPTIANNFGTQLRGNAMSDSARIYLARDERQMAALCERRGIRYLILRNVGAVIRSYAAIGGIDFDNAVFGRALRPEEATRAQVNDAFSRLPYGLLYGGDGVATKATPAMTRFRLVHEETARDHDNPADMETVKIFEFVRGARVTGKAAPGRQVILFFEFATDGGRVVSYANSVTADANGDYSAVFPYSTTKPFYGMTPSGSAVAAVDSVEKPFDVTEEDVLKGNTVVVR